MMSVEHMVKMSTINTLLY